MMFTGVLEIQISNLMGLLIGSRGGSSTNLNQFLGIEEFNQGLGYSVGNFVTHNGTVYRFISPHTAGEAWDVSEVEETTNIGTILACVGETRIKPLSADRLKEGDMLFYDRALGRYCTVAKEMVADVLASYNHVRYETNHDTYIGTFSDVAHFTARDDAAPTQDIYSNDTASTPCYYRIEIDNTQAGELTFSANSGNGTISTTTITWEAGDSIESIVAKFTAKSNSSKYITFAALTDVDGTCPGVGLALGGYGENKMTVTGTPVACRVIDCSGYAFRRSLNPGAPAVGDKISPDAAITFLGLGVHHNFCGAAASTILSGLGLVAANTVAIAMDGFNYSYRCGINFAKFKEWATTNGDDTYYDDGEGGTNDSAGHVMKKSRFDSEVTNYTGENSHRLGMKEYYNHLYNDQTGEYATLRQKYEAMYGQMTSLYDAYLMSHMADPAANSGIVSTMRNKGKKQTQIKGDCMNVNYNYVVVPAYPPEYNALNYGIANSEGFRPGIYHHPEPGDLILMFRDDIRPLINANIAASGGGTQLPIASRGSCADYSVNNSWYFTGTIGALSNLSRYGTNFPCRPSLALPLSN